MKNTKLLLLLFLILQQPIEILAQICPNDPPQNPYFAESVWPMYHRNNYRQASTCISGPLPSDSLVVKVKSSILGGTSPWTYISDLYPNGERVIYQSNATHVFKFLDTGNGIITIDSLRIDFDPITSFGYNFLLTNNKVWFTLDPKYNPAQDQFTILYKLTDENINDPFSEIISVDTMNLGDHDIGRVQQIGMNYLGQIVFNAENNDTLPGMVGIISQDFELLDTLVFPTFPNEITYHNAFPIDEENSFYIVTTHRLIKFSWDNTDLAIEWEAFYDFVNDGPTGQFAEGSGTTPTLMGLPNNEDKLIVLSDGHADNNLLAFWRKMPADWTGIPGEDIRLAGKIQLPAATTFSNIFQSIENSPTVYGYDVAIAQYNGFLGQECPTIKGVQKIRWDTIRNEFFLQWVNDSINMNNVLTYSAGSNIVYGSGKEDDCSYYFYGLDWDSGEILIRQFLGEELGVAGFQEPFDDAGAGVVIDEFGDVYFPGGGSLVKIEKVNISSDVQNINLENKLEVFPNPTKNEINISSEKLIKQYSIYDILGRVVLTGSPFDFSLNLNISNLNNGIYVLSITNLEGQIITKKIRKEN